MKKLGIAAALAAFLLAGIPMAQAATLAAQPDHSTLTLFSSGLATHPLPAWNGPMRSFDLYLSLSAINSVTGDPTNPPVSDTVYIAFPGCTGSSAAQSYGTAYQIPISNTYGVPAQPALIHFVPSTPIYNDGSGACSMVVYEESGLDTVLSAFFLHYALMTNAAGQPYFVAYDTEQTGPTSKDQCKNGGWAQFGTLFKNQGDCVSSIVSKSAKH